MAEQLWTREELLAWYNSGYREFLARSQCVRRLHLIDIPPRYSFTYCYEWEVRHTQGGPSRMIMLGSLDGTKRVTSLWETEQLEGVTPTTSWSGKTQEWERAYGNETDRHFVFMLPHQHDRIKRVAWDDKVLLPVTIRDYDETRDAWMRRAGEPTWWLTGTGRVNSIEIYQIQTDYTQQYALQDYAESGFARFFSGVRDYAVETDHLTNDFAYTSPGDSDHQSQDASPYLTGVGWRFTQLSTDLTGCTQAWEVQMRNGLTTFTAGETAQTYAWEGMHGGETQDFGIGIIRSIVSPDRQYWAMGDGPADNNLYGAIRDLRSSTEAVEVTHVVIPEGELTEPDLPDLLPTQAQRYLRYYVWSRAYGRSGPGQQLKLAQHYRDRFERGVKVWRRLADLAFQDRVLVKESTELVGAGKPPYVRLPANYPEVF